MQIPPVPEGARDWTPYRAQAGSLSIRMAANCRVTLKLGPMALEAGAPADEVYVDQPFRSRNEFYLAKNAGEEPR